ncbi:Imm44 family immunity protein [Chryseobacterium indoltheticum]|uniref:Immunity protein 44 n=1 Tax=Chryseobacterium indoltheticum TaxID=254 RepID=A0A1N6YH51_9FLAO|nr:Imm44 family immunity protein [Chryseobacterium indoltheticum]AZA75186.1 hypothetical protein EG358_16065 [Chryseobacterium indoltheticum]SIR13965.1 Immunity protein 44 [Chryseobacterium indoltheticum]SIR41018.1 Immunity protein 44 [Chryseobacterium indoltheticum]SUX41672.1 Uncharacterised protein [Chryseobacterium indoltheticum]
MTNDKNIFGCFVSYPSLMYDATEDQKSTAKHQGDLFHTYIYGDNRICNTLKTLNSEDYGKDLKLALFQFYVNPMKYEVDMLKEIESYRKNEKSIGIPIIITDENFFSKSEEGRFNYLKQTILQKIDLLKEVVKKKKLDTNMELLKSDLNKVFQ